MSTNSNIGYKIKSGRNKGKFKFIYSHWDGYLSGVGKTLLSDYNSESAAMELVQAGDCSYPGDSYAQKGEDYNDVKPVMVDEIDETFERSHTYIWDEEKWLYSSNGLAWQELKGA